MSLTLHTIHPAKGSKKKKKTVGRGGKRGTYSGKGLKGQKARSGVSGLKRLGSKPLMESTPKLRGFKSRNPKPEVINLKDLNIFSARSPEVSSSRDKNELIKITPQILKKAGLVDNIKNGVKILGKGEIRVKIEVSNCQVSASAKEGIEKVGGSIVEIKKPLKGKLGK